MSKIFIIIAATGGAIALGFFVLWPQYQEMNSVRLGIDVKEAELEGLKEYFSSLEKANEEMQKYPEVISKINSALPGDPSIPALLYFIDKKAAENGVVFNKIGSFGTSLYNKERKINATIITLGFSFSYEGLKSFLSEIEKSERIIEVENISFSTKAKKSTSATAPPAADEDNIFAGDMKIKTYSY